MLRIERGSTPVESIFVIVLLTAMTLGVVQIALTLYARNVVMASLHEGARAAAVVDADADMARWVALRTMRRAAGELGRDIDVSVSIAMLHKRRVVTVEGSGLLRAAGPIPIPIPLRATASIASGAAPR